MTYGFNSGHFLSTIKQDKLPFHVILAADSDAQGRALFHEIGQCPNVLPSIQDLLTHVTSKTEFSVCGYAMHSPRVMRAQSHPTFWRHQATVILEARRRRGLHVIFLQIHDATPATLLKTFSRKLVDDGWVLTTVTPSFPDFGDSIDGNATIIIGIHNSVESDGKPLSVAKPPLSSPSRIEDFIIKDFNKENYIVSWGRETPFFAGDDCEPSN